MTRSNKMKYYNYYNKMLNVLDDYTGKIKFYDSYFKVTDEEITIKFNCLEFNEIPVKVSLIDFNDKYYLIEVITEKLQRYCMELSKVNDSIECYNTSKDIKESTFNNAFNRTLKYLLNRLKLQADYDKINYNFIAA